MWLTLTDTRASRSFMALAVSGMPSRGVSSEHNWEGSDWAGRRHSSVDEELEVVVAGLSYVSSGELSSSSVP